ncbi:hypothetical protein PV11_08983 [Exophiala sideris]|uniref:Uncharacterized protein n=1 Tax=Exophiala sideris TaxID=1016849 RepID=A0A0D1Y8N8_9EURO|nr:hypothetical protein PV11_08983 [Exophiala sideris]
MFSKYSIVDVLPPANSLSHLSELCVSPFLTGHIDNGTEFVLGFSVFALSSKLELILKKMERLPAMHNIVTSDASLARRFMSIAPVLSALAILDIQRLTQHTSIGAIEVSRIVPHQEPGTITVVGMTVTATMFTWFT